MRATHRTSTGLLCAEVYPDVFAVGDAVYSRWSLAAHYVRVEPVDSDEFVEVSPKALTIARRIHKTIQDLNGPT